MDPLPQPLADDPARSQTTKSHAPVTWSIRGVERDTRAVIEKAAERVGKTMGQYVNEDVRSFAQGQSLRPNYQPPRLTFKTRSTS